MENNGNLILRRIDTLRTIRFNINSVHTSSTVFDYSVMPAVAIKFYIESKVTDTTNNITISHMYSIPSLDSQKAIYPTLQRCQN